MLKLHTPLATHHNGTSSLTESHLNNNSDSSIGALSRRLRKLRRHKVIDSVISSSEFSILYFKKFQPYEYTPNHENLLGPLEADVDWGAAKRNKAVLFDENVSIQSPCERASLTKLLSLQQTTWLLHCVPPMPMTVIGLQDRPL